jgi:hypothetical protein
MSQTLLTGKRKKENKKEYRKRKEHFYKHHGPNPTHDSDTCKVLLNKNQDKPAWKDNKKDYKDFKSKYKNNGRDLKHPSERSPAD